MRSEIKLGLVLGIVLVVGVILYVRKDETAEQTVPDVPVVVLQQEDTETAPKQIDPVEEIPTEPTPKPIVTKQPEPTEQPTPEPVKVTPVIEPEPEPKVTEEPVVPIETGPKYHIVKKGDSLSSISESYYGNGKYWRDIFNANRTPKGPMQNANTLQVGWKLRIPSAAEIAQQ